MAGINMKYSTEIADIALTEFVEKMIGFAGLDTWTLLLSMQRDIRANGVPDDIGLWLDWLHCLWHAAGYDYDMTELDESFITNVRVKGKEYRVQLASGKESIWPTDASELSAQDGEEEGFYFDTIVRRLRSALEIDPGSEDKRVLLELKGQWHRF
ncbi:hypothetical protein HRK28_08310 [Rathayibacter sp. VKM Ac-2835]|uniref:hypothetical protein n=1 Tax=Rathayibacter sp. VKM Ac-2835 TaxID=2739043 RepID=UPI001566D388|nr:hypothetical protein [Rathayibacter sp. VKM Ac-2835]NRG40926.1 hypothetical protein [Rathayibacter sp. VKM Ac-2835]